MEEWKESYHSTHGALQEAKHVYLNAGLKKVSSPRISILELGFGTGLNAILTFLEANALNKKVEYTTLEAYPVSIEEVDELDYTGDFNDKKVEEVYRQMHSCSWNTPMRLSNTFLFVKKLQDFRDVDMEDTYDLVYYDAFGPRVQPELWSMDLLSKIFKAMKPNGILVTYSSKGSVRRTMIDCGFKVEKLPGPPGKREMLRAIKPNLEDIC